MDIGKTITKIREQNNLSQDDMANNLFVSRQAVSRWENGLTSPSIDTLKLISQKYNISANELLGLMDKPICQSCGMNLNAFEDFGTNADNGISTDYCTYCYQKGKFSHERTIDEMIESNLKFLDEYNKETGCTFTPEQARVELKEHLSALKRWK